jgi:hypothetical protein
VRGWVIALLVALLVAAGLTLLNRGVTLAAPLRWPAMCAGVALAAGAVWQWRAGATSASKAVRAALAALTAIALGWLLHAATVTVNQLTGAGSAETVTAVVADLVSADGWIPPAACAVVLEPWRSGAPPVALPLTGGALLRDASGAIAACRTAEGSAVQRGERVALRTRIGGLGLEYLTADANHALLVPPCNTCGKH